VRPIVLARDEGRVRVCSPEEFLSWLRAQKDTVAVDTETSGLEWEATVRLVQFGSWFAGYAISVTEEPGRELVQQALRQYPGQLIFHNAPFDIRRLDQIGVDPDYIWPRAKNTHVMSHVYDPAAPSHKLKDLGRVWLGDDGAAQRELKERIRKHNLKSKKASIKWDWGTVPRLVLAPYGIEDTVLTHNLHDYLMERLTSKELSVCAREYEVAEAVAQVSYKGMQLDVEYARGLQTTWGARLDELSTWFTDHGVENPNANRQIAAHLIGQGWVPHAFTPSGEVKLDKPVLKSLADDYPLVANLLEHKRITKWKAAYVDNCLDQMDSTGRVHAGYNSLGARTGRMSCSNPPLQQLPKGGGGEVRRLFIASPGNLICSVDYSAIEMRLAGHFADDPVIKHQYANDIDVYEEMAQAIGCTRPQAKIASLAALYGSRGKSIARALGVSPGEAVAIVNNFWDQYPALSRWAMAMTHKARGNNHVESRWGRRLAPHAPYAAGNAVIQGTAAEVMKDGILRLAEHGLLRHVVAIVHDEVVLDVPEAQAQEVTDEVSSVLEDRTFSIPLLAEGAVYGRSWGDGYALAA